MTSHLKQSADGPSSPSLGRFGSSPLATPLGGKSWILYLLNLITAKTRLADLMAVASYLKAAVTMAGNRLINAFDHVTVPILNVRAQQSQCAQGTRYAQAPCEVAEMNIGEFTSTITTLYAAANDDLSVLTTQVMKAHETTIATMQADLRQKQSYKVDLDAANVARRRLAAEKAQLVLDNADLVTKHDELANEAMQYIKTDQELQRVRTAMSTLQDQHRDLVADTQRQAASYRAVIEAKDAVVADMQDQLANYKAALATKNDVLAAVAAKDAVLAIMGEEIERLMALITLQTKDSSTASRGSSSRHKSHKWHNAIAAPIHSCAERDLLLAFLESIPDTKSVSYLKVYAKHNEDMWAQLRHIDGQQLVGFYAYINGRVAEQLLCFKASCDAKKCVPSLTSSDTSTPPGNARQDRS